MKLCKCTKDLLYYRSFFDGLTNVIQMVSAYNWGTKSFEEELPWIFK